MAQAMPWLRYLRNSTYYHFFRKAPPVEELHQASSYWAASQLGVVHQNPTLRSVWLIRNCLDLQGRGKLLSLVRRLSTGAGGWFGYELGRWMMPLHALPALDEAPHPPGCGLVEGLDVFGPQQQRVAAAPEKWLRLGKLRKEQVMGAEEMYQLQEMLPQRIAAFQQQRCLFIQLQRLEPGAEVTAHRDALPYGGDRIATVVLEGSSQVRVGSQTFQVNAGDCYAIADEARYVVEHEVKAASCDRLSLTFRYGLSNLKVLPAMPGEELRAADRGGSALWEA